MAAQPSKSDITAIFKRLKSIPANKQCFDCGLNNPTWASVTYGVFLCIDCSAVHRSLGVHVTFIRSTQLDTSWTWLQLRSMQIGGNGNATLFFRQHGCTTNDAQQKYHSRAASLYREKLVSQAHSMMKMHGTKLHLDVHASTETPTTQEKEIDFFEEHTETLNNNDNSSTATTNGMTDSCRLSEPQPINNGNISNVTQITTDPNDGPSVEAALSISPSQVKTEPRKSVLGAKKSGLAKKGKGLGAHRVKTNFNELESRAQQLDKEREDLEAVRQVAANKSKDDEVKQMASMRLAYKDHDVEMKRKEEKLKITDPNKAEQLERLGMGLSGNRGISHSVLSDMTVIDQEAPSGHSNSSPSLDRFDAPSRTTRDFFEDELDKLGGFSVTSKSRDGLFGPSQSSLSSSSSSTSKWGYSNKTGSWDVDRFERKASFTDSMPTFDDSDKPSRNRKAFEVDPRTNAQDKFGNVKSISSDQFFGPRDLDFETKQSLSKFEGSSSISSDDFFGGSGSRQNPSQYAGTDLSDIKEGVRQGVTKVAGKLSSLANGVMSSIQEKYGS